MELAARLTTLRGKVRVMAAPALHDFRMAVVDFLHGQAFDHSKGLFTPERLGQGRGLPLSCQGFGRLPCAQQVTGQQGARTLRGQVLAQPVRLLLAQCIEWCIQMPLKTKFPIPVGFAMPHQPQINHVGHYQVAG